MLIYDFQLNTQDSNSISPLKKMLHLIEKFWKFSKNYGEFIATPLQYRHRNPSQKPKSVKS